MKGKSLSAAMVLMGMGLVLACGCAGNMQAGAIMSSTVIDASQEEVWDTLCNFDWTEVGVKKRMNGQGRMCEVGTTEDQVQEVIPGMPVTLHFVISEAVVNEKMELKFTGDNYGIYGVTTYLLSPEGKGTRLTVVMEGGGHMPPGITYETVKSGIQKSADNSLEIIKAKVEK